MKKSLIALTLLFGGIYQPIHAQTVNTAKLDSLMDVLAANNKSMGSLAISQNGHIIYQKSIGYAAIDSPSTIPSTAKTRYRIGSISKMFTGVMIFQLIEQGKLTLQTTLDKYYPQIPNAGKITVGMMLNHHSGLHNFTNDPAYLEYMVKPQTHDQMLTRIAAMKPDFEPGAKGEYSNTNFVLLGYIVEKLTNKPYATAVKSMVIDKAGLKDTYYGKNINTGNNEALSYTYEGKWKKFVDTDMSIPGGAGGMVSTPADLDKFIEAIFNGTLVKPASLAQMETLSDRFGMAMFKTPFNDKTGYGHGGAIDMFRSLVSYFPDQKLAVAYIANGGSYTPEQVLVGVLSIYFKTPYSIPTFAEVKGADKYVGVYSSTTIPLKITITTDGAALFAQATGQSSFPLDAAGQPDVFKFDAAGIVMEFHPATSSFTLKQGGAQYEFTKEQK
ncbi:serine hydrolase domain-containing protein [Mucilaginibacter litoreus]|uniref:Serine hydrolase domain-containing protein n=1 Tax=Mucilaginibacter litoreus TaxID=1048221 RepID=A0ABW3AQC0_9SPHI